MKCLCFISLFSLTLLSCIHIASHVAYTPNPLNVEDPIETIKSTIEQQPTAYAYMPVAVEVDDNCIKLYMSGSTPQAMPIVGGQGGVVWARGETYVAPETVCYKNIGKVKLAKLGTGAYEEQDSMVPSESSSPTSTDDSDSAANGSTVWRVEINDLGGQYMYWVYSYRKADAEKFIDAIYHYVELPPGK